MISKLVNEYVEYQAMKNKFTIPEYKELVLKMDPKLIKQENNDGRKISQGSPADCSAS